jgi:hypothetical protein
MIKRKSIMENKEFLSLDENSLNTNLDPKTRQIFLDKVKEYTKELLKDKQEFVDRYKPEDVEKILKGKAIKDAIIYIKNMKRKDIKELVIKSLTEIDFSIKGDPYIIKKLKEAGISDEQIEKLKKQDIPEAIRKLNSYYSYAEVYEINSKQGLIYAFQSGMSDRILMYDKNGKQVSYLGETINSKKYITEREKNPEDKITMDVPLFIRMLEYAREDASTDIDLHDVAKKAINLSSKGKVLTMDDYENIIGELEPLNEDDWMQKDDESDMAKSQLKSIQSNTSKLMNMIDNNEQLDAWVQSKLTRAQDYLQSVSDYLTGEEGEEVYEKKLTPAEKKKKEEIVKSMKKDFKGPKPAMYAIATDKAKDLAEIVALKVKENLSLDKKKEEEEKEKEKAWVKFQKDKHVNNHTINDARKAFEKEWTLK